GSARGHRCSRVPTNAPAIIATEHGTVISRGVPPALQLTSAAQGEKRRRILSIGKRPGRRHRHRGHTSPAASGPPSVCTKVRSGIESVASVLVAHIPHSDCAMLALCRIYDSHEKSLNIRNL